MKDLKQRPNKCFQRRFRVTVVA